jgi:carbon storage regulator CsrA
MEERIMLVLSRKTGEKIHIGSGITISVVAVAGSKVRIGIDAPREVPVVRAELNDFLGVDSVGRPSQAVQRDRTAWEGRPTQPRDT